MTRTKPEIITLEYFLEDKIALSKMLSRIRQVIVSAPEGNTYLKFT